MRNGQVHPLTTAPHAQLEGANAGSQRAGRRERKARELLGAGLLISTVSATQQQAMVTAFFFIMPAITFSGFGFPMSTMPPWLQSMTYASPLRYFLIVLRGTYLKGVGMDILWPQMAAMAGLATLLLLLATLRLRKSLD